MNEHTIANVYLYLSFLLRIMFVKKKNFSKLAFILKQFKLMREYLARNLKAGVNILVLLNSQGLLKLALSHNVVCIGTSSIRMAWTWSLKYLSVKPRLLIEKC